MFQVSMLPILKFWNKFVPIHYIREKKILASRSENFLNSISFIIGVILLG